MTPELVSSTLNEIESTLGAALDGLTKTERDAEIGKRIAAFNGYPKPYSRTLVYLVKTGKKKPSPAFAHAVMAFAYGLDSTHPLRARALKVSALAVGSVAPGSLILADSRYCENPQCGVPFIPRTPTQRHCCRACQVQNYNLKRRGQ